MIYHWIFFRSSSLLPPNSNSWSDVFIFQTPDDRTRLVHAWPVSIPKRIRKRRRSRRPHGPPEPMPRLATPVQWHGLTVSETKLTLKVLRLCTMKLKQGYRTTCNPELRPYAIRWKLSNDQKNPLQASSSVRLSFAEALCDRCLSLTAVMQRGVKSQRGQRKFS